MGFRTVPDELRAAGKAAIDAAGALRSAHCAEPVGQLPNALPGGAAAGAATSFSQSWESDLTTWCTDAERFGTDLGTAARNYQASDQTAHSGINRAGTLRGPQ
ncbi:hypothetical protein [Amycolatopsis dendrobii]|uniref:Excreted virulence factor EspC, type VII ESX diderm n=1 Tax=Amycolatopsis dendrobii TaxID=2760662 RepID=A0A7W3VTQ3_9PSEU|nr:hypothetical protein [Amycolatopsis dendrobii]MBB1152477.1 hypothetical protein [Amycolatopsis dendrobii]